MIDKQQSQTPKSKDAPETGSSSRTRVQAQAQAQRQRLRLQQGQMEGAANVFKQLFATLEAEQQKLQQLEQRRLKLTEEMRTLRDMLQQENLRLRQSTAATATTTATTTTTTAGSNSTSSSKVRKSILRIDTSKNSRH
ncbi:hypothetical protein KR215_001280 [Drosophila sulfurigaster]|nr:hypothetical protein KR215_001280 [Drosophila sulfurigaster]